MQVRPTTAGTTPAVESTARRRTAIKVVAVMHSIYERARRTYGLRDNPVADVERIRHHYDPARFDFYSPEEIAALVRAAASEQDATIYLTAAYTGARPGERRSCFSALERSSCICGASTQRSASAPARNAHRPSLGDRVCPG
jgi:hypothetical protein